MTEPQPYAMTMWTDPYLVRLHRFLQTRLNLTDEVLQGKTIDELKGMLPKKGRIDSPNDGFAVFDLLHSHPEAPRVRFRNFYLYPNGARCDVPQGQYFGAEDPPTSTYRRASAIVVYWQERLRPVQAEFDQLKKLMLNDKTGFAQTDANLAKLEELYATAQPWAAKLAEAIEAKEAADPKFKTPERREAEEAINRQIRARKDRIVERATSLSL